MKVEHVRQLCDVRFDHVPSSLAAHIACTHKVHANDHRCETFRMQSASNDRAHIYYYVNGNALHSARIGMYSVAGGHFSDSAFRRIRALSFLCLHKSGKRKSLFRITNQSDTFNLWVRKPRATIMFFLHVTLFSNTTSVFFSRNN